MLELKISIPELKDYVKSIPKIKDNFFDLLRLDMKQVTTEFINGLMQTEFELFMGREKYLVFLTVNLVNFCEQLIFVSF